MMIIIILMNKMMKGTKNSNHKFGWCIRVKMGFPPVTFLHHSDGDDFEDDDFDDDADGLMLMLMICLLLLTILRQCQM